jgi:hypothetical protein
MVHHLKIRTAVMWVLNSILICGLTGCSRSSSKIEQVLVERARAQAKYVRNPRNKTELDALAKGDSNALLIAPAKYTSALQKIDVSHCPTDFQVAWVNYLKAWQDDDGNEKKFIDITQLPETDAKAIAWRELNQHFHGAALAGDDF